MSTTANTLTLQLHAPTTPTGDRPKVLALAKDAELADFYMDWESDHHRISEINAEPDRFLWWAELPDSSARPAPAEPPIGTLTLELRPIRTSDGVKGKVLSRSRVQDWIGLGPADGLSGFERSYVWWAYLPKNPDVAPF